MTAPNIMLLSAIGVAEETGYGTAAARTHWFRCVSATPTYTNNQTASNVLYHAVNSLNMRRHYLGNEEVGLDFEIIAQYEGIGLLLKHCLRGTATTGSPSGGIYPHTFTLGTAPPTGGLTIEHKIGNTGKSEVYAGCRVTKFTLSVEAGGQMRLKVSVIAQSKASSLATSGTPSFTTNEIDVLHMQSGTIGFNSGTYLATSLEFSVDHGLTRQFQLGSVQTVDPPVGKIAEVMLKMDMLGQNEALRTAQLAGTQSDLTVTFTGAGSRTFLLTLDQAFIVGFPGNATSGPGVLTESYEFRAESDGTNEGLTLVINNTLTTATAA